MCWITRTPLSLAFGSRAATPSATFLIAALREGRPVGHHGSGGTYRNVLQSLNGEDFDNT
jgi:hypothetical protein